jgi:hypothetical protein
MDIENAIETVGNEFIARQNYDTEITRMKHQVIPIPNVQVPVLQQRMYGSVVNYHYLQVEFWSLICFSNSLLWNIFVSLH